MRFLVFKTVIDRPSSEYQRQDEASPEAQGQGANKLKAQGSKQKFKNPPLSAFSFELSASSARRSERGVKRNADIEPPAKPCR
jgi:hypothetical protein